MSGWEHFLNRRIAKEMCKLLPFDTRQEPSSGHGKQITRFIMEMFLAGVKKMWRMRCKLAAGVDDAIAAVGTNETHSKGR